MSFKSHIRFKLIIGKLLGITYTPLNMNNSHTLIDYFYPLPIMFSYVFAFTIFPEKNLNFQNLDTEKPSLFTVAVFLSQCWFFTIIKWIYSILNMKKFQQCIIDINRFSLGFQSVNLKEKSLNNFVFMIIIVIYIFFNFLYYFTVEETMWFRYLYALPIEIAEFEQYFIYDINKTIYLIVHHINKHFATINITNNQDRVDKLIRIYNKYKEILILTKEFNKAIGFFLSCSLCFTLTGLISIYYQFHIIRAQFTITYCCNCIYFLMIWIRLYFTVYNWEILIIQVRYLINQMAIKRCPLFSLIVLLHSFIIFGIDMMVPT